MSLIDAGEDCLASGYKVCLTMVVVEMESEKISHSVICAIFEIRGGKTGNKFVSITRAKYLRLYTPI